jgi:putative MFS transporter
MMAARAPWPVARGLSPGQASAREERMQTSRWKQVFSFSVIVAGLGYFVDMFDLTLFAVVRQPSVEALGVANPLATGLRLYQTQMLGMMLGGLLWGVMGDRRGRLSVLFGSILLYSLGNIANAFVTTETQYIVCRFITGVGLAGELGAAITLVAEQLPKEVRGLGTTVVATMGISGAIAAALVGQQLSWKAAYLLGGAMGLLLLLTRFHMRESTMFQEVKDEKAGALARGNVLMLLRPARLIKYLSCIFIGMPIYFSTGLLMSFAPEMAKGLGVTEPVTVPAALIYGTIGLTAGDLFAGVLSQVLHSRRAAVGASLAGAVAGMLAYLYGGATSALHVYLLCGAIGIFAGYWAVLVTMAAEQFGTNIRATVATTVPNFVRGSGALITLLFSLIAPAFSTRTALLVVGLGCYVLAFAGLAILRETFGKPLDFVEQD